MFDILDYSSEDIGKRNKEFAAMKRITHLITTFLCLTGMACAQLIWPTKSDEKLECVQTPNGFAVTPLDVSEMFEPRKYQIRIYADETSYYVVRGGLGQTFKKAQKNGVKIDGKTGVVVRDGEHLKDINRFDELKK